MSSRFLCADLNNIFYAHGGVQNPCYRSIVSNTETFETRPPEHLALWWQPMIIWSKRPNLKKILIAPKDGVCTTELVPFSCYGGINHRYLVSVWKSSYVTNVVNSVSYGVKMPRVGKDIMENLIIPLPPLAEQKRIVEKLDKLLPLCEA